ncbi:MAG: ModD protein [Hungatella sp.]|jgi:molybdenum transport protein|nr:ModD protein [Hungatella sp.]
MFFTCAEIDHFIEEDVPYMDLTSHLLGLAERPGTITYFTRERGVVCGTEVVEQMFRRLDIRTEEIIASGERMEAGCVLISGSGSARQLHTVWKAAQNVLDHCSGIATKTRNMVDAVQSVNKNMMVLTTRKSFPGAKKLSIHAILSGGAIPHRLGLSETVLIFEQHVSMLGGYEELKKMLPDMKKQCPEKKILIETNDPESAGEFLSLGADGIQFDKMSPKDINHAAASIKQHYPQSILLAAGGIHPGNAIEYANTGVDGIVTTSLYTASPLDIGVKISIRDC